eukprot:g2679.t1
MAEAAIKKRQFSRSVTSPDRSNLPCVEGYLKKMSRSGKWQQRYWKCNNQYLNYYKDKGSCEKASEEMKKINTASHGNSSLLKGSLDLLKTKSIALDGGFGKIQIKFTTTAQYYDIEAESLELATVWVNHLKKRKELFVERFAEEERRLLAETAAGDTQNKQIKTTTLPAATSSGTNAKSSTTSTNTSGVSTPSSSDKKATTETSTNGLKTPSAAPKANSSKQQKKQSTNTDEDSTSQSEIGIDTTNSEGNLRTPMTTPSKSSSSSTTTGKKRPRKLADLHKDRMSGWISKQSPSRFRGWQERYCVIKDGKFIYFKSKGHNGIPSNYAGSVDLTNVISYGIVDNSSRSKKLDRIKRSMSTDGADGVPSSSSSLSSTSRTDSPLTTATNHKSLFSTPGGQQHHASSGAGGGNNHHTPSESSTIHGQDSTSSLGNNDSDSKSHSHEEMVLFHIKHVDRDYCFKAPKSQAERWIEAVREEIETEKELQKVETEMEEEAEKLARVPEWMKEFEKLDDVARIEHIMNSIIPKFQACYDENYQANADKVINTAGMVLESLEDIANDCFQQEPKRLDILEYHLKYYHVQLVQEISQLYREVLESYVLTLEGNEESDDESVGPVYYHSGKRRSLSSSSHHHPNSTAALHKSLGGSLDGALSGSMTGQEVLRVMDWIVAYDKVFNQIIEKTTWIEEEKIPPMVLKKDLIPLTNCYIHQLRPHFREFWVVISEKNFHSPMSRIKVSPQYNYTLNTVAPNEFKMVITMNLSLTYHTGVPRLRVATLNLCLKAMRRFQTRITTDARMLIMKHLSGEKQKALAAIEGEAGRKQRKSLVLDTIAANPSGKDDSLGNSSGGKGHSEKTLNGNTSNKNNKQKEEDFDVVRYVCALLNDVNTLDEYLFDEPDDTLTLNSQQHRATEHCIEFYFGDLIWEDGENSDDEASDSETSDLNENSEETSEETSILNASFNLNDVQYMDDEFLHEDIEGGGNDSQLQKKKSKPFSKIIKKMMERTRIHLKEHRIYLARELSKVMIADLTEEFNRLFTDGWKTGDDPVIAQVNATIQDYFTDFREYLQPERMLEVLTISLQEIIYLYLRALFLRRKQVKTVMSVLKVWTGGKKKAKESAGMSGSSLQNCYDLDEDSIDAMSSDFKTMLDCFYKFSESNENKNMMGSDKEGASSSTFYPSLRGGSRPRPFQQERKFIAEYVLGMLKELPQDVPSVVFEPMVEWAIKSRKRYLIPNIFAFAIALFSLRADDAMFEVGLTDELDDNTRLSEAKLRERSVICDDILSQCADIVEEERIRGGEFSRGIEQISSSMIYHEHLLERLFPNAHKTLAARSSSIGSQLADGSSLTGGGAGGKDQNSVSLGKNPSGSQNGSSTTSHLSHLSHLSLGGTSAFGIGTANSRNRTNSQTIRDLSKSNVAMKMRHWAAKARRKSLSGGAKLNNEGEQRGNHNSGDTTATGNAGEQGSDKTKAGGDDSMSRSNGFTDSPQKQKRDNLDSPPDPLEQARILLKDGIITKIATQTTLFETANTSALEKIDKERDELIEQGKDIDLTEVSIKAMEEDLLGDVNINVGKYSTQIVNRFCFFVF